MVSLPATTKSPSTVHTPAPAPDSPAGASPTGVAFAPVIGSLQSLRSRTNAICRLSGDQNGYSAPDESGSGVDLNSFNARSHSRAPARYSSQRPSGDRHRLRGAHLEIVNHQVQVVGRLRCRCDAG